MSGFFTILIVIAAILLILVVLIQKSKGGGLASNFSSNNAILGVKKTTDGIEKATWILASIIMVLSIATVSMAPKTIKRSAVEVQIEEQTTIPDMSSDKNDPLQPIEVPNNTPATPENN